MTLSVQNNYEIGTHRWYVEVCGVKNEMRRSKMFAQPEKKYAITVTLCVINHVLQAMKSI